MRSAWPIVSERARQAGLTAKEQRQAGPLLNAKELVLLRRERALLVQMGCSIGAQGARRYFFPWTTHGGASWMQPAYGVPTPVQFGIIHPAYGVSSAVHS